MSTAKISVTVDAELLAEARRLAPAGNLSALVGQALAQRVKVARAATFLAEAADERGPIPARLRDDVRRQWPE